MWISNGEKSSALGTLPSQVRDGVLTAFRGVYQGEKSGGSLQDFCGDLTMIELSGGNVLPGYRSEFSARGILAAIAVPFRNTQGTIIQSAEYLALASDSATDRAAHKAELVYYRTMFEGKPRTAFLSCQALPNGTASGIFSSYKRAFTAAGLEVTDWIPKLVWYCADGARVMQGRHEGVYAPLREQRELIRRCTDAAGVVRPPHPLPFTMWPSGQLLPIPAGNSARNPPHFGSTVTIQSTPGNNSEHSKRNKK